KFAGQSIACPKCGVRVDVVIPVHEPSASAPPGESVQPAAPEPSTPARHVPWKVLAFVATGLLVIALSVLAGILASSSGTPTAPDDSAMIKELKRLVEAQEVQRKELADDLAYWIDPARLDAQKRERELLEQERDRVARDLEVESERNRTLLAEMRRSEAGVAARPEPVRPEPSPPFDAGPAPARAPSPEAANPAASDGFTSSINGLAVVAVGASSAGKVSRIVLVHRASQSGDLQVRFVRGVGPEMQASLQEGVRYWEQFKKRGRYGAGTVEISFEDKYSKKDGPSAGAAYAVLMRSFSDGFRIDDGFAMTGDISVEGRILRIGGAFEKVRAALRASCKRVGIPGSNESELYDGAVLQGLSTLAQIEVYGLGDVEGAIRVARTDRDEKTAKASKFFGRLRSLVGEATVGGAWSPSAEIDSITSEILLLAPDHLSAKLLREFNNGRFPKTLSIGSSLDRIGLPFYDYLAELGGGRVSLENILRDPDTTLISKASESLRGIRDVIHSDTQRAHSDMSQVMTSARKFIAAAKDVEAAKKALESHDRKLRDSSTKVDRARAEGATVAEYNALVKRHNDLVEGRTRYFDRYNKELQAQEALFLGIGTRYAEYVANIKKLTQDPEILEKLIDGK
ncbi:MAG TPA: S16 family serine protease, partial [Planctomycetota bacterium]|nr:S16 family serine protease [Planctomycetota bacterium]